MKVYIAGPMTGYEEYNFPAFDDARDKLALMGHEPISPADLDREIGFDVSGDFTKEDHIACIWRDVKAIIDDAEAVCVLPGWEKSKGANAEVALAVWKGIPVFLFPSMSPMGEEDVLAEALRITGGDRNDSYGPPSADFARTAKMWSAMKGIDFSARDVALFMIAIKMSRECHSDKRDNWVDIAGYARCGSMC